MAVAFARPVGVDLPFGVDGMRPRGFGAVGVVVGVAVAPFVFVNGHQREAALCVGVFVTGGQCACLAAVVGQGGVCVFAAVVRAVGEEVGFEAVVSFDGGDFACAQAVIPYGGTDGVGQVLVGEALAVKRQNAADGAVGLVDVAVVAVSDADLSVPAAAFVDFAEVLSDQGAGFFGNIGGLGAGECASGFAVLVVFGIKARGFEQDARVVGVECFCRLQAP